MWGLVARRLRVALLVAVAAAISVTLVSGGVPQLASWNGGTPAYTQSVSAATMPAPSSASGGLASSSSTSSYAASSSSTTTVVYGTWTSEGSSTVGSTTTYYWQCSVGPYVGTSTDNPPSASSCSADSTTTSYSCPNGGTLSGTSCDTTVTTYTVDFAWNETSVGPSLIPDMQVVSASSCTSASWTTVATVTDSTGSYTVNSPSSSDYYGIRSVNGSWLGPVTSCTQG
jgi:hypothetical protein